MKARLMVAAVSAVGALALLSGAAVPRAEAMAMYNNSTYYEGGVSVRFICGFFCGWTGKAIGYHEQKAYPGKGGSFSIVQVGCIMSSGHPNIEDHGYAVLTGSDLNSSGSDIEWHMWGNGGNVIGGSPFDVVCFPSQRPQGTLDGGQVNRQFRLWDRDRDGVLLRREIRSGVGRDFRKIDLDRNGVINVRDVRLDLRRQGRGARQRVGKTELAFDLGGDGKVRSREYWRYVRRTFVGPMDRNGNGRLSRGEARAFYAQLQP